MPQLTWLGDHEAKRTARRVPYRLLDPVEQVGDPASANLLIQGDNLEALKALLPFYAGRVKCIFIDPPVRVGDRRRKDREVGYGAVARCSSWIVRIEINPDR